MDIVESKSPDTPNILTLTLKGRLDGASTASFEERMLKHIDEGERRLLLDLADLDYISSVGLRALILASKRLKPLDGRIVLYALKPGVRQVFEIAGFSSILGIVGNRDEAVARLS
jgi:stage II sporulation protein AA (anti-sigma F factor antagonist)